MSHFHHLAEGISCHAWNADHSMLAICPNTNEIWIYSNCQVEDVSKWKKSFVLKEHDMVVSGLDWSPVTNMIVSCSHDRNAIVWKFETIAGARRPQWKPTLVLLRTKRSAFNVKWSPDGKKFAVATGAKSVPVCYYEPENDWWISKQIKRPHKSTVLDIDWHPNSQILATGSSDMKCRVFSAYISNVDGRVKSSSFGDLPHFGELIGEFDNSKGWVESVAWSPQGSRLAFAGHDSSIHFVHFGVVGEMPSIQTLRLESLPLERIMFLSQDSLIGSGHDFNSLLFSTDSSGYWQPPQIIDKKSTTAAVKSSSNGFSAARSMWESKVSRGQSSGATSSDKGALWTKHESAITYLQPYSKNSSGNICEFTSSGLDGRIVFWKLMDLNLNLSNLHI